MENPGAVIKGIYRDQLFDGNNVLKFDSGWNSNTIMDSFHVLLARFVLHDPELFGYQKGYLIMRLAEGEMNWDTLNGPPQPASSEENLDNPYPDFLQGSDVVDWVYLGDNQTEQGETPSHQVRIKVTVNPKTPLDKVCLLREFALYLRLEGLLDNPQAHQDFIINHVRHPLIAKAPADTLTRQIQFTF